jgi:hypothetical protein
LYCDIPVPDEDEGDNRFELESVSDDEQDEADLGRLLL